MSFRLRLSLTALMLASLATLCGAASKHLSAPQQAAYVITNDDGLLHTYVSFFLAGGTQGAPTLTFASDTNTRGTGIGGGFFAIASGEPAAR